MLLDKPYLFEQFPNFNSFQQCPAYFIFRFTCSNAIGTNSNHGAAQGDRHNHADNKPEQDKMKSEILIPRVLGITVNRERILGEDKGRQLD